MSAEPSILVVDDDPSHLRIYGWIMQAAGFRAVAAQAVSSGVRLPGEDKFDVAILDYRLVGSVSSPEAARQILEKYPNLPIVVLSDVPFMPEDMEPYAREFVRKGEPEMLIATVTALLSPEKRAACAAHKSKSSSYGVA